MISILEMFKIGIGPSSSHTVGPMRAAAAFADSVRDSGLLQQVGRVRVTLYGSLSLTGFGHGTDRAAMAGLEGNLPSNVDPQHVLTIREECEGNGGLMLADARRIPFDYEHDMIFEQWMRMAAHPNGMRFEAFDVAGNVDGEVIAEQVWYSVGGGFIRKGAPDDLMIGIHEQPPADFLLTDEPRGADAPMQPQVPYDFESGDELVALCKREGKSISEIVWANELALQPAERVRARLLNVWRTMNNCVRNGCMSTAEVLPGELNVKRRAPKVYERLSASEDILNRNERRNNTLLTQSDAAWVDLFALAVSEENAGGGRIVTAPTNGAAGIIPAVVEYYWRFVGGADEDGILKFLLAAGAIGYLFRRNASISGAEVGCQGEVGSACSMASAGLCEVTGGTPAQVENAAEIGIEHHLGLTCDPVSGLVQIPCIERNAMAANMAINAVHIALLGDGSHIVTLDQAIKTMKDTGADMMDKYKETSKGGLAVNVVEC